MKFIIAIVLSVALINSASAKIYTKCEFARVMFDSGFTKESLPDWVCLAIHESALNSNVVGGPNTNGSFDWGIFQINDNYWCKVGYLGNDCNMDCNKLVDEDLTDDIACTKIIFARHGFTAWNAWKSKCQGSLAAYQVDECF
ncbi:lysozyme c-1-like [Chironomus tepperi]|uniref:lysozyme c-1-like n=1 Tax=Chironomus tepperi TaxID=113505 RepID=UPI00391FC8B7